MRSKNSNHPKFDDLAIGQVVYCDAHSMRMTVFKKKPEEGNVVCAFKVSGHQGTTTEFFEVPIEHLYLPEQFEELQKERIAFYD